MSANAPYLRSIGLLEGKDGLLDATAARTPESRASSVLMWSPVQRSGFGALERSLYGDGRAEDLAGGVSEQLVRLFHQHAAHQGTGRRGMLSSSLDAESGRWAQLAGGDLNERVLAVVSRALAEAQGAMHVASSQSSAQRALAFTREGGLECGGGLPLRPGDEDGQPPEGMEASSAIDMARQMMFASQHVANTHLHGSPRVMIT